MPGPCCREMCSLKRGPVSTLRGTLAVLVAAKDRGLLMHALGLF